MQLDLKFNFGNVILKRLYVFTMMLYSKLIRIVDR